jgi:hypothetical protein
MAVNGGLNAHMKTHDTREPRFAPLAASGSQPADLGKYRIQGWPVLAPCAGHVLAAVDGLRDITPPKYDIPARLAGTYVILDRGQVHVVMVKRPGTAETSRCPPRSGDVTSCAGSASPCRPGPSAASGRSCSHWCWPALRP